MTQEEKAKRYDEALHKAKNYYSTTDSSSDIKLIGLIFPELKESEDEKIRKEIIELVMQPTWKTEKEFHRRNELCVWLEKQCEQKPIISNNALREGITHFGITQYQIDNWLKKYVDVEKQGERESEEFDDTNAKRMFIKALERVEEQNNKGYKLTDCDKNSWWEDFKAYTSCTIEQKPAEWNTNDEQMLNSTIKDLIHPCYEEIPDRIEEEIKWIKSMRNRVVSQPKQEWSEEDEYIIEEIEAIIDAYVLEENNPKALIDWLKSLRPQNRWKPSERQKEALLWCVVHLGGADKQTLGELLEELNKL